MAIKVERMTRDFVFNNIHLHDPNPELPIEKVRVPRAKSRAAIATWARRSLSALMEPTRFAW